MNTQDKKRSSFSGKIGFVLSAAGASVGLGNIWRFPYLAAKYGGGIFLIIYILLALTFGYSMIIAETSIGRMTGKSPVARFFFLRKIPLAFLRRLVQCHYSYSDCSVLLRYRRLGYQISRGIYQRKRQPAGNRRLFFFLYHGRTFHGNLFYCVCPVYPRHYLCRCA